MNRRQFSKLGLAGGALGLHSTLTGCAQKSSSIDSHEKKTNQPYAGQLGVQLYTVRDLFQADYKSTLKTLADIGYKNLETAGFYDHAPKDVKAHMDSLGLVSHSAHVQLADMRDNFGSVMETANTLSQTYLVIPWLAKEERTLDGYKKVAELLNKRGEEAKNAGMRTAYHNHDFEFDIIDGKKPYDVLLSETDPDFVDMEIDLFWTHKAGVDPLSYFKKHPGRFFGCHIKDSTTEGDMVAVGNGIIDFNSIFKQAKLAGLKHFYVEHDTPKDPITSIQQSFTHLSKM